MPISLSTLSGSSTITAAALNDVFEKVEEFINGNIDASDLQTSSAWINFRQIVRPHFF